MSFLGGPWELHGGRGGGGRACKLPLMYKLFRQSAKTTTITTEGLTGTTKVRRRRSQLWEYERRLLQ